MKLLIVAATWTEIKPLEQYLLQKDEKEEFRTHAIELLITGPGSAITAFHLGKMLPIDNWDLVVQLGICGSFNRNIAIGTTVNVSQDTFADLGAEDDDTFLDIFELGLLERNTFPFREGWLINSNEIKTSNQPSALAVSELLGTLQPVKGITVNSVSGNEDSIRRLQIKFQADVESMEGAAFLYCCIKESLPCLQIRTVSNYIEKRNRKNWDIPLAIKNLNETAIHLLGVLLRDHPV